MKKYLSSISIITILALAYSCNFSASYNKDFTTGITSKGNGLSAESVYLSDGEEGMKKRDFTYGEVVYTNFESMEGFEIEGGKFFPQMSVAIVTKGGDTIMQSKKLFADGTGFDAGLTTLNGNVKMADPIVSDGAYSLHYKVWDTKGDGVFASEMDFKVKKDPLITSKKKGLDFTEIYIIADMEKRVVTDGVVHFNESLLFNFQDLSGYTKKNGAIEVKMDIKVTDDSGTVLLDMKDAFKQPIRNEALLKQGLSATLTLTKGKLENPITWQVHVQDKNSDASFEAAAELTVAQ